MSRATERAAIFACSGDPLVGIAHLPGHDAQRIGVLVVVGGPQYRVGSHRQFTQLARYLAERGFPVLRFDYRGMGDSGGAARAFDEVDEDIAVAIDTLSALAPGLRGVVLWGLCDAASACMIYGQRRDPRVIGLVLANPWVRTNAGEAAAYIRHYYIRRLLQRSFWAKVFSGSFNALRSVRELIMTAVRARSGPGAAGTGGASFIERMRRGLAAIPVPVLLIVSGRDLTAREFVLLCERDTQWRRLVGERRVTRKDLPDSDHTFSASADMIDVNASCVRWLQHVVESAP